MKTLKTITLSLIFILSCTTTQAQFFKKLEKKAKEKIAREAERRAERRVNKKIEDTFDKTEEVIDNSTTSKPKENTQKENTNSSQKENITISDTYSFEWEQTLEMKSKEGAIDMIYLLTNNAHYFAIKMVMEKEAMQNMLTVVDDDKKAMISLMEIGEKKIKRVLDTSKYDDQEEENNTQFTVTETDTKTILGYQCQGYKIVSKEGIINAYVALNAPVSSRFGTVGKAPKGFNANAFKKIKKGLLMEMTFVSNKRKKYNMTMTCTSLKQKQTTINTKEYGSFGF